MNLLICGGAGFIGSNFVKYWLAEHPQMKILVYDKLTYAGNLANLSDVKDNPNFNFVEGDICDGRKLESVITKNKINIIVILLLRRTLIGAS